MIWIERPPKNLKSWLPLESYGETKYFRAGQVYTLRYNWAVGFYLSKCKNFLENCLKDIADIISVAETGYFFWKKIYVTLRPKINMEAEDFIIRVTDCLEDFQHRHKIFFIGAKPPAFEKVVEGTLVDMIKEQKKEPSFVGDILEKIFLYGGLTIIGAIAVKTFIEKKL